LPTFLCVEKSGFFDFSFSNAKKVKNLILNSI
jgi:hypothetical protein